MRSKIQAKVYPNPIPKGTEFDDLTVIGEAEPVTLQNGVTYGCSLCRCKCGREVVRKNCQLKRKRDFHSCEFCSKKRVKPYVHYNQTYLCEDRKENPRLYTIWRGMVRRCHKVPAISTDRRIQKMYRDYRGRGISVCDEWRQNFIAFVKWAKSHGYDESLTIDRVNNDGNYEPSNCRWITRRDQNQNKRPRSR